MTTTIAVVVVVVVVVFGNWLALSRHRLIIAGCAAVDSGASSSLSFWVSFFQRVCVSGQSASELLSLLLLLRSIKISLAGCLVHGLKRRRRRRYLLSHPALKCCTHTPGAMIYGQYCAVLTVFFSYSEMITLRSSIPVVVSSRRCPLPNCRLSVINTSTHGHTHWPIHLPADLGAPLNAKGLFFSFLPESLHFGTKWKKILTDFLL